MTNMAHPVLLPLLAIIICRISSAVALKCVQCYPCTEDSLPDSTDCPANTASCLTAVATDQNTNKIQTLRQCIPSNATNTQDQCNITNGMHVCQTFCKTDGCNKTPYVKPGTRTIKCVQCSPCTENLLPDPTACPANTASCATAMGTELKTNKIQILRGCVPSNSQIKEDQCEISKEGIEVCHVFCKTDGCNKRPFVKPDGSLKCVQCDPCDNNSLPEPTACPDQGATHCMTGWGKKDGRNVVIRKCYTDPSHVVFCQEKDGVKVCVEFCKSNGCNAGMYYQDKREELENMMQKLGQ